MNYLTRHLERSSLVTALVFCTSLASCGDRGNGEREFGCGCFASNVSKPSFKVACKTELLCPTLDGVTAEGLDCAIDAIAAGEPGQLLIKKYQEMGDQTTYVFLNGDPQNTAFVHERGWNDLLYCADDMGHYVLADTAYFEQCASLETVDSYYQCFLSGLRQTPLATCWMDQGCSTDYE